MEKEEATQGQLTECTLTQTANLHSTLLHALTYWK